MAGFPNAAYADSGPILQQNFIRADPANWLATVSEIAVERLHALKQRVVDAGALLVPSETMRELHATKAGYEARTTELTKPKGLGGHGLDDDAVQVVQAQALLKKADAELQRAKQTDELRTGRWRAAGAVVANVLAFLESGIPGGCALRAVDVEKVADLVKKNERILDAVERLQRRGRELKADLHRVRSSPYPASAAKAVAIPQIKALADAGAPDTSACIEILAPVAFATKQQISLVRNVDLPGACVIEHVPDAIGLICWAFRDQIIAKIEADIDQNADDTNALTEQQRQEVEAQISTDLLATERAETTLIFAAQREGANIEHRPDTNPLALLALELVTAPPHVPASGTSPEHVTWRR